MFSSRNQIRSVSSTAGLKVVTGNPSSSRGRGNGTAAHRSQFQQETSSYDGGGLNTMNIQGLGQNPAFYDTLLTGLASDLEVTNQRFYRDIYHYDTTAGSCIDLMASMPFSDFTLSGVQEDRLEVYNSSIEQLNLKTYFPEATVDYLVDGFSVASLMFDSKTKTFTDMVSHPPGQCQLIPVPLRSRDPLITVKQSDSLRQFVSSSDPRVKMLRDKINKKVLAALSSGEMDLDPISTVYMARRTFTYSSMGTSILKRLLPIYFLEKTLYKGTIVEAGRRQRSLLHLAVGDDTWEPTVEELQAIVGLFQQADLDPLGAIIATRAGVNPNEMRQGGDFWKWTDIIDILQSSKLRALGISESFLAGDATFNNMETGLSVFMQNQQMFRERATQAILYNKIFPLIAAVNGFEKIGERNGKSEEKATTLNGVSTLKKMNDKSRWDTPTVTWKKSLGRDTDSAFMDILDKMATQGIPVSMRMYAAAGGVNLETLADDLQQEKDLKKKWAAIVGEGEQDGSGDEAEEASLSRYFGGRSRRAILGRDFGETGEISDLSKTGKRKYVVNQREAQTRANLMILKAAREIADPHRHLENLKKVAAKNGGIPNLYQGGNL